MSDVTIGGKEFSDAFSDAFGTTLYPLSATFNVLAPIVNVVVSTLPSFTSATFNVLLPSVSLQSNLEIIVTSSTFNVLVPELLLSETIQISNTSASFNVLTPTIDLEDIIVLPSFTSANFDVYSPVVNTDVLYEPDVISTTLAILTPAIFDIQVVSAQTQDLYFVIPSPAFIGQSGTSYCAELPHSVWDKFSTCHNGEKDMFDKLEMGAWNKFGVQLRYYLTDYNKNYDKNFGEDRDRLVVRAFDFNGYFAYPPETREYITFGIDQIDTFQLFVSINHMEYVSRLDTDGNSSYLPVYPNVGDIIYAYYSNIYYEIIRAKKSENQFLQTQHSWTITVRVFRDNHLSLGPAVSAEAISACVNKSTDLFQINQVVHEEKSRFLYDTTAALESEPPNDPGSPNNDPFAGW